ncbi:hypothetical protein Tco_0655141 [Tanacetum coccineum]|uniref:Uncharacterized protein n=1 Tax=Tanacetum coccineum TaxID=301880 RepID=A0ABQ4X5J1_9ASTR
MHEYITTNPNIPTGSEKQNKDKKKLTNWVLKLMLNFEFVSYQGKFMNQYKQPSKDSQQLICYKKMIAQQERSSKELENVFSLLSPKLAEED